MSPDNTDKHQVTDTPISPKSTNEWLADWPRECADEFTTSELALVGVFEMLLHIIQEAGIPGETIRRRLQQRVTHFRELDHPQLARVFELTHLLTMQPEVQKVQEAKRMFFHQPPVGMA